MAGYVFQNVDLSSPITKVMAFPNSVSVQTAAWNKLDLTLASNPWYVKAIEAIVSKPLINNEWLLGLEIEVENVNLSKYNEALASSGYHIWNPKPDHSLRNNGLEFVSIPMKGAMVHKALYFLAEVLGPKIDFSPRTSVHVHINVRDMTISQIASLGVVYAAVERLLFKWVGKGRATSIFCVPLYETHDLQGLFAAAMTLFNQPVSFKYSALNFNTTCRNSGLPLYGTVEFRHLYGTLDANTIIDWINLIFCIKKFVMKRDLGSIVKQVCSLNTTSGYGQFLSEVFGLQAPALTAGLNDPTEFQDLMEQSVSEVKRCAFANNYHQALHDGAPAAKSPFTKALRKKFGNFVIYDNKPVPTISHDFEGQPSEWAFDDPAHGFDESEMHDEEN
ncbi:MAG: hypothetical protein MN733_18565 [Nitrososphaera sp.]|nr:hypothetical protein [Nitrososphaera sp.]